MKLSVTAQLYYNACYMDGDAVCIQPRFTEKSRKNEHAFTEEILNELLETGDIRVTYKDSKYANICGRNKK
ncbi:hypothetical protein [Paenibacillus sp. NAIST15-1]|uniref:hypothetical protein n=1 Tax=Paenibacillus sp. NAIST15-1 TaxID=1605994 RepID=UPI00086F08DE|nr:hypothetical protein [Paenibacillus sp. NAIST15-1]GAV11435.1 hypothetical protein PBN151_1364 [Paenibacillus sp. NAIST15-1]